MIPIKVLIFAGSSRKDSLNKKLAKVATNVTKEIGAEVTFLDLKDFEMPLYNGDLEAESGLPENAKKLKTLMKSHDAVIISSPEYNSSVSPLLKNTIDWISRKEPNEENLAAFTGKIMGIMSASPSGLGGIRGLVHLRALLENIQVMVVPDQISIPSAQDAFNEQGELKDEKKLAQLKKICAKVVDLTTKIKG